MRSVSVFATAVLAAAGACDQPHTPMLTGIATTPTGGSAQNGSALALQVIPEVAQLVVGTSFQLQTNAPVAAQSQVLWRSANPTIAAVDGLGIVTALSPGVTSIRASYAFDTARVAASTITVVPAAPQR